MKKLFVYLDKKEEIYKDMKHDDIQQYLKEQNNNS